ncbi:MAG: serine hydrolase domain-containing protein, partial [Verrucomicrobiota bacterium]
GKLVFARGYGETSAGSGDQVGPETMFSVASLSKVATAAVVLRLTDQGVFELDRDVGNYLESWSIPASEVAAGKPVTIRGILSHTAGLSVHGFADFQPGEPLPSSVEILQGLTPAKNKPIEIIHEPGTRYQYSGGGYQVLQLAIEDTLGEDFASAAARTVMNPLSMSRTTFWNPLPSSVGDMAKGHDRNGDPSALPRGWEAFPEMAASGLWTTPSDYARLLIALAKSAESDEGGFLSQRLALEMLTEVAPSRHGLGPALRGEGRDRRLSHGGSNESYKAECVYYPDPGEGFVAVANGANGAILLDEIHRAIADVFDWPSPE